MLRWSTSERHRPSLDDYLVESHLMGILIFMESPSELIRHGIISINNVCLRNLLATLS